MQSALSKTKVTVESLRIEPLTLSSLQAVATADAALAYQNAIARVPQPAPRPEPQS
jgi:hypothetical protein